MGVVYKARHHRLNRLVALKMIRGGSQARAEHLARFRIEAEAVAQLRHPNIVQIYDIGEADGLPFVALEFLDGGGLADRLAGTPQPGRQAAELMATLARAVHAAHQRGHRPPRPQAGQRPVRPPTACPRSPTSAWPSGSSRMASRPRAGQIMGTPSYMAPEQAAGQPRTSARRPTSTRWGRSSTRC